MAGPDSGRVPDAHTVASALRLFTRALADAGIEGAGGDARRLLSAALNISSADLLREPERILGASQFEILRGYIERRAQREPVSRILGQRDFYGRTFAITPATLDPRPDSETLITAALELVAEEGWTTRPLRILDVGTGSGCLLLTLLAELPAATGLGTDISPAALDAARVNAGRLGLADRAEWLQADALEAVPRGFHMLVANPPYVRTADIASLEAEVRCFDPLRALDGGADGLDFYRRLVFAAGTLVEDGWLILEVGHDQADAVAGLLGARRAVEKRSIRWYCDVAGKRRCVAARTLG